MKVVDMHCDTITVLYGKQCEGKNSSLKSNDTHLDIEKMKKGDYLLQNFAIFTPYNKENRMSYALNAIDKFYQEIEANSDDIMMVKNYADIMQAQQENKIAALLTLEEGAVVDNSLAILRDYYRLGVRMIALTWNYYNEIGYPNIKMDAKLDRHAMIRQLEQEHGLTDFGKQYVQQMNQLGMIVDVSHLGDKGFWDVEQLVKGPFVASHSNARSVCDVARNLDDNMIAALAKHGGVMGINYCEDFLANDGNGNINAILAHIDHIVKVGGINTVGLGSDFDGISTRKDLVDGSQMDQLATALFQHGYDNSAIEKIFSGNVLRVYKEVLG